MPKKIDWKFVRSFSCQNELDDYLDSNRPTTIAKSNLNSCTLCPSDLIEPHKMRSQYLNCNSKLCGPKCQARYLVLNCENAGKIDFYSINEHVYNPMPDQGQQEHQHVEDHLSRKCKKIIEFIIVEKHITKPRFILRDLQQNEANYELASIPSLQQITSYVRNKLHNMKTKGFLPLKYKSFNFGNLNQTDANDIRLGKDEHNLDENGDYQNGIGEIDNSDANEQLDREVSLADKLNQIQCGVETLEKNQKKQIFFTCNYFEDIESRLKENRNKIIKEIEKNYKLFAERINYLKNKFKIDNKIENNSSELEELKAKSEKLKAKFENNDHDMDNLDLLLNEAKYITEQLESSIGQIDQHIGNIKRIRYEPGKMPTIESGSLLGDLYYIDDDSNKKRKLDF